MTHLPQAGSRRFILFVFVGTLGFFVDSAGMLILSRYLGFNSYVARLLSMGLAITATWLLNRYMTFRATRHSSPSTEYLLYLLVQLTGAGANYGVFALLLWKFAFFREHPVAAVAIGSLFALAFNYLAIARFVFNLPAKRG